MLASLLTILMSAMLFGDGELGRSPVPAKDIAKISGDVADYFEALAADQRSVQTKILKAIVEDMDKAIKRARVEESTLTYLEDWEILLESAKPELKGLKSLYGKGLKEYVFTDPVNQDWDPVMCFISIPKTYTKMKEEFPPAVLVLLPDLTGQLSADELMGSISQFEVAYTALLDTHIVLIPVGRQEGTGRKAKTIPHQGSWLTDENLYTLFTGMRVLLEQLRFDRSQLVLDGWGNAGEDALRVASISPAWFAGVVNRDGPTGDETLLLENLEHVPVLYVQGSEGPGIGDLPQRSGETVGVKLITGAGTFLEPSTEALDEVNAWIESRERPLSPSKIHYKLGDIRFQSVNWVKAMSINKRPTARPQDDDFPRVDAEVNGNTITLNTVNVFEVILYLSDSLVDLDEEVVIVVNGEERVRETFARDAATLLENRYFNNSGDAGLYTAEVSVGEIDANLP